ncbi:MULTISPECIES: hypothetical protein [unclassified Sphingomonas]|uniref:hypothetical protein n=1 Tax=unclassified Sphingomonas TaxID=196159 RepID=UPI0012E1BDBB|nr:MULTISPECIES: hypothetical protein [unclassified Sphingomonas]
MQSNAGIADLRSRECDEQFVAGRVADPDTVADIRMNREKLRARIVPIVSRSTGPAATTGADAARWRAKSCTSKSSSSIAISPELGPICRWISSRSRRAASRSQGSTVTGVSAIVMRPAPVACLATPIDRVGYHDVNHEQHRS